MLSQVENQPVTGTRAVPRDVNGEAACLEQQQETSVRPSVPPLASPSLSRVHSISKHYSGLDVELLRSANFPIQTPTPAPFPSSPPLLAARLRLLRVSQSEASGATARE